MVRFSILLFLLVGTLFGYSYNELLIKAQNAIFPKILLLDKNLDQKLVDGEISYTIVCETSDYHTALALKEQMDKRYRQRLGGYPFKVRVVRFEEFTAQNRTTALYVLNSENDIDNVTRLARESGIITFAYDMAKLKEGVLLSLVVEKSTIIYLNKNSLPDYNIDFVDSLYQIVKFMEN